MAAELDLDAARAARAEARGEPPVIIFGGERFTCPGELPFAYFDVLDTGDMNAAIELLLNGQADRFRANLPSPEDLREVAIGVPRLYGFGSPGESPASGGSSAPTGKPSRRTSPAGTKSTSAKQSTARKRSGSAGSGP